MTKRPEENETFIRFVQAAREDREFEGFIRNVAKVPVAKRNLLLGQMAAKMKAAGERADLVEVVEHLKDPKTLHAILHILDEPWP